LLQVAQTATVEMLRHFVVTGLLARVEPRFVGELVETGLVVFVNYPSTWVLVPRAIAHFVTRK
jgi:hypothetical protein